MVKNGLISASPLRSTACITKVAQMPFDIYCKGGVWHGRDGSGTDGKRASKDIDSGETAEIGEAERLKG